MPFVLAFVVAIAIVIAVVFARQLDRVKRARFLKRAGFTLTALSACFIGAFIAGETFTDPGGWKAAGLVAAWAVPLAGLAAAAWHRPGWAVRAFAVLTAAVIGMSIWFAVSPLAWRSFENRNGPIRDVITFVLTAAIAVLGLKRTAAAGILLVVAGIVPAAVSGLGSLGGSSSLAAVSSAPVITGVLYLLSACLTGRQAPPARTDVRAGELPKAA